MAPYIFSRAKEIKTKLGILLQKPDSAVDLVIPYNEKPEKPAKTQKWVTNMGSAPFPPEDGYFSGVQHQPSRVQLPTFDHLPKVIRSLGEEVVYK